MIKSIASKRSNIVITFTDQLVSTLHAPLLIEHLGRAQYISGMEAVAHVGYGLRLITWVGTGFEVIPDHSDAADVLRALLRYYAACDSLGSQWLMREQQTIRFTDDRSSHARRQLRLFQSALMHTHPKSALPEEYRSMVKKMDAIRKGLTELAGS